jgi:hypothetical protein
MSQRSNALAERLEQGARALADLASGLTDPQWTSRGQKDKRKVGVLVHHVATMYPLEIQLAQTLAAGKPIVGVTWDLVSELNAKHAKEFDAVTKQEALDLLDKNSTAVAAVIRALSDEELDRAAPVSLKRRCPPHLPVHSGGTMRCGTVITTWPRFGASSRPRRGPHRTDPALSAAKGKAVLL